MDSGVEYDVNEIKKWSKIPTVKKRAFISLQMIA